MKAYIEAIIGAALLCTLADMIAPSKWQSYIRLVTGLVIISVILSPVSKLRNVDILGDFEIPQLETQRYDEKLIVAGELKKRIDGDVSERLETEFGISGVGADTELELNEENQIKSVKSITVDKRIPKRAEERLMEVYGVSGVKVR